jgi:hypothetical protein
MVAVPPAIIFVNRDLTDQVRGWIMKQLHITAAVDGYTFDASVAADSDYVDKIHRLNLRLLVERPFTETQNRELADVVIFVKNGLASVEVNNFGPPGNTFPVLKLHWGQLGIYL